MDTQNLKTFANLAQHGHTFAYHTLTAEDWSSLIAQDPEIPQDFDQLVAACQAIYGRTTELSDAPSEECGMFQYARFVRGLGNPSLTEAQLQHIEKMVSDNVPDLNEVYEDGNVTIHYTTTDKDSRNNTSLSVVKEIADNLNLAWEVYEKGFGVRPFLGLPFFQLQIHLYYLKDINGYSAPYSPMLLNSHALNMIPSLRKSTSAHELFHYIQFNFGLLQYNSWFPTAPWEWFIEGSAAWASIYVTRYTSSSKHVTGMYESPQTSLVSTGSSCATFWIYCDMMTSLKNSCLVLRTMLESLSFYWKKEHKITIDCFELLKTTVASIPETGPDLKYLFHQFNQTRRFFPCTCDGFIDSGQHKGETRCYYQIRDFTNCILEPKCTLIEHEVSFGQPFECSTDDIEPWSLRVFRFIPSAELRQQAAQRLVKIRVTGNMAPGMVANFQTFQILPNGNGSGISITKLTNSFEFEAKIDDFLYAIDVLMGCCDVDPEDISRPAVLQSMKAVCSYFTVSP